MKAMKPISALLAAALFGLTFAAQAQGLTREQVKMDRDAFLALMRWDEVTSQWVLKSGMEPPAGVKSRAEVIQMRDEFLRMNRWDEQNSTWVPLKAPREMSTLTRDQVSMETVRFTMMFRWDESKNDWVSRGK